MKSFVIGLMLFLWTVAMACAQVNVTFKKSSDWGTGFTGEMTLTNSGTKDVMDWTLVFNLPQGITNIWGGTIASHSGSKYTVQPESWNKTIRANGGSITVGFNASPGNSSGPTGTTLTPVYAGSTTPTPPTTPTTPTTPAPGVADASVRVGDVTITYKVVNDWKSGFQADVTIKNETSFILKNWAISFQPGRSIASIWNARVLSESGGVDVIDAATFAWNKDIPANGSVNFGFNGTPGNLTLPPTNFTFTGQESTASSTPTNPTTPPTNPAPPTNPTTPPITPPSGTPYINYGEALQKSLFFYDAQRSGVIPQNFRINWKGDSALNDGKDVGVDLTGGFYDAGDHVKFGLPMMSTITLLCWGGIEYKDGYVASNQWQSFLSVVRWGTDWIIKAHPSTNVLYGQVGTGDLDHSFWGPAEVMPMARPAFAVTAQKPGTELAGEGAASMAAASILFAKDDPAYSKVLLTHAKQLFDFADQYRGTYVNSITDARNYYNSYSGYNDELVWSAAWLYRATNDPAYLVKAENYYNQYYNNATLHWTHSWDDKSYGASVLLAELTKKAVYKTATEKWLNYWSVGDNGSRIATTPGGLGFLDQWGSLRYATTTAFLAYVYSDTVGDVGTRYQDFARRQIDYALGSNPAGHSYVVGYGVNPPKNPHHRTAHGSWSNNIANPVNNRHTLYGALVGGPSSASDTAYADDRTNYVTNEVALDYNAGFTGALARLEKTNGGTPLANFPVAETPDDEFFVEAAINQSGAGYTEIRALLNNRSAFPATGATDLSFHYYVNLTETIAAGYTPAQIKVTVNYSQGANVSQLKVYDAARKIYYVDVDFTGTLITPGSSNTYWKEVQFRMSLPSGAPASAWNPANDFSYTGLTSGGANVQKTTKIPVFTAGELLTGSLP